MRDSEVRMIDAVAGLFWACTPLAYLKDQWQYWNGDMTEGN